MHKIKISTLLLMFGAVLIGGCIEEQAVQPTQEDKIVAQNETVVSNEDTKHGQYTTIVSKNGYEYTISGDISGPISGEFPRDDTAPSRVKIGDKVAYFTGTFAHWASVDVGKVVNISENSLIINSTTDSGRGINKVNRTNILEILD
jgi:hypothetical protein